MSYGRCPEKINATEPAPMQCRSPTNFLRLQEWSVRFERDSAVSGKFRRLINNATEPATEPYMLRRLISGYL